MTSGPGKHQQGRGFPDVARCTGRSPVFRPTKAWARIRSFPTHSGAVLVLSQLAACSSTQPCPDVLSPITAEVKFPADEFWAVVEDPGDISDAACQWLCPFSDPVVDCKVLSDLDDSGRLDGGEDTGATVLMECTLLRRPLCI